MRRHFLDNIRWGTVLAVVFYHVIYMYNGIVTDGVVGPFSDRQPQDAIQYILYPWMMLLLFLVAGASARYALEKQTTKEFIRSRTRKLLVPSTIGLLVFGWIQGYFNMAISGAFEQMGSVPGFVLYLIMALSGTGVLWFIQMLWLYSMLLVLVRKFEKGILYEKCGKINLIGLILLVIPVYLSGLILNLPVVTVYRFGIYAMAFFLGYFVFAQDHVSEVLRKYAIPLLIAAVVLGVVYLSLHFGDNYAVMPTVNSISAVVYAWTSCLAIWGCVKRWGDKKNGVTEYLSRFSWGLYIFHYLPLSAVAYALRNYTTVGALPSYLVACAAAFIGSFVLYEAISRIPVIRWCVLGIR